MPEEKGVKRLNLRERGATRSNWQSWKAFEREVASFFRGRRVPLSGSNSGHETRADVFWEKGNPLNNWLFIECKKDKLLLKSIPDRLSKLKEGKVGIIPFDDKQKFLVIFELKTITQLLWKAPLSIVAEDGFTWFEHKLGPRPPRFVSTWKRYRNYATLEGKKCCIIVCRYPRLSGNVVITDVESFTYIFEWLKSLQSTPEFRFKYAKKGFPKGRVNNPTGRIKDADRTWSPKQYD